MSETSIRAMRPSAWVPYGDSIWVKEEAYDALETAALTLSNERDEAQAQVARLTEALRSIVDGEHHLPDCSKTECPMAPCDCWDEKAKLALSAAAAARPTAGQGGDDNVEPLGHPYKKSGVKGFGFREILCCDRPEGDH